MEILAGVLSSAADFIRALTPYNVLLAARCYGARSSRPHTLREELIDAACALVSRGATAHEDALVALLSMDEADATRAFYNMLPGAPSSVLTSAKHAFLRLSPAGATEESLQALTTGTVEQREIALHFVAKIRIRSASHLVVAALSQDMEGIAAAAAEALGRLQTPETIAYLTTQARLPPEQRRVPLHIAASELDVAESKALLFELVEDPDSRVRTAALMRMPPDVDPTVRAKIAQRLEHDPKFVVRLVAAQRFLDDESAATIDHVLLVRQVFGGQLEEDTQAPASQIFRFLSGLNEKGAGEALLQALCHQHRGIQSVVSSRILKGSVALALNAFDLIDLSDGNVAAGPKIALVDAVVRHGKQPLSAVERAFAANVAPSVRQAVLAAALSSRPELFDTLLPLVLNDETPLIRGMACRILTLKAALLTEPVLVALARDPDDTVRKATRRLLASDLVPDSWMASLSHSGQPLLARQLAVGVLIQRRFRFPLELAHELVEDPNAALKRYGWRILRAISRSGDDPIGIVTRWNSDRGFGFVRDFARSHDTFFHISEIAEAYAPRVSDLVRFRMFNGEKGPEAANVTLVSRIDPKRPLRESRFPE
jgi:cold shock CspA family protein